MPLVLYIQRLTRISAITTIAASVTIDQMVTFPTVVAMMRLQSRRCKAETGRIRP
jgi:hypothetical protein